MINFTEQGLIRLMRVGAATIVSISYLHYSGGSKNDKKECSCYSKQ